ncbi:MAG TPA: hypothetical protein PLK00_11130, partial [Candidatus Hydrogenedentes bacterium]|nr:hypothetical protein [Candidatus Hydrogenedentota bacterium]
TTPLALRRLAHLDEVVPDVSKWRFRDSENGGSECYCDGRPETVRAEAEKVSQFSLEFPNVTGGYYDDMKGLMTKFGHGAAECARIHDALRSRNPRLRLHTVVYSHELDPPGFWQELLPFMDVVTFWVWGYERLTTLEDDLKRCRDLFGSRPILMGCYLRDYPSVSPMPMESVRHQWRVLAKALAGGLVDGYDILATVLIDGHLEQAEYIRDFIKDHS